MYSKSSHCCYMQSNLSVRWAQCEQYVLELYPLSSTFVVSPGLCCGKGLAQHFLTAITLWKSKVALNTLSLPSVGIRVTGPCFLSSPFSGLLIDHTEYEGKMFPSSGSPFQFFFFFLWLTLLSIEKQCTDVTFKIFNKSLLIIMFLSTAKKQTCNTVDRGRMCAVCFR